MSPFRFGESLLALSIKSFASGVEQHDHFIFSLNAAIAARTPCHTLSHFEPTSFRESFHHLHPVERKRVSMFFLCPMLQHRITCASVGRGKSNLRRKAQEILTEFERAWNMRLLYWVFQVHWAVILICLMCILATRDRVLRSSMGPLGITILDASGWPMIVIDLETLNDAGSYGVIPHEFFHAVQHACDTYSYDGESAWYWESTAMDRK